VLPSEDPLRTYGSDAAAIVALAAEQDGFGEPLHPHLPYTLAQIVWACRMEMARSLEDALSRRTRCLLLDARAAAEVAPRAAAAMAAELGWDEARTRREIESFRVLAQSYTVAG
jgi:glycerol-3-phosphate dehydrogenase